MFSDFRDFIMRGNVVDLAVAVVIGAAFGGVVTSFTGDILLPLLGLVGLPNFEEWTLQVGEATLSYGLFINALVTFLLIAAAIYFFVVKPMQRFERPAPATTKTCTECASEIPLAAKRCPMCAQPQA